MRTKYLQPRLTISFTNETSFRPAYNTKSTARYFLCYMCSRQDNLSLHEQYTFSIPIHQQSILFTQINLVVTSIFLAVAQKISRPRLGHFQCFENMTPLFESSSWYDLLIAHESQEVGFLTSLFIKRAYHAVYSFYSCGSGEIRTHGPLSRTTVFKTVALNHSATLPLSTLS